MAEAKYGVVKSGDPNTKYGKYFVFKTQPNPFHPTEDPEAFTMYLDERSVEGGFYFSGGMVLKADPPDMVPTKPHYHDYVEYLCLLGTNPDDQSDLGGEVEFWLDDEKHTFTNTCIITIPARLSHCPFSFKRVDRPILFYSCSNAPVLYEHINHDPKWSHLADPPKNDMILD